MIVYSSNQYGNEIEVRPNFTLNLAYWECNCERNYIKPMTADVCDRCGYHQDDCPSANEETVQQYMNQTIN